MPIPDKIRKEDKQHNNIYFFYLETQKPPIQVLLRTFKGDAKENKREDIGKEERREGKSLSVFWEKKREEEEETKQELWGEIGNNSFLLFPIASSFFPLLGGER